MLKIIYKTVSLMSVIRLSTSARPLPAAGEQRYIIDFLDIQYKSDILYGQIEKPFTLFVLVSVMSIDFMNIRFYD